MKSLGSTLKNINQEIEGKMMRLLYIMSTIVFAQSAVADTPESNLGKYSPSLVAALSSGVLEARRDSACLKQVSAGEGTYIANKDECLSEINAQLDAISDIDELSGYRADLVEFGVQYGLIAGK